MRILVDEEDVPWTQAWKIVTDTFFFTNHTVLPVSAFVFVVSLRSPRVLCFANIGSFGKMACPLTPALVAETHADYL